MHAAQKLIDAYAEQFGLAEIPLNADGCARVSLDGDVAINFEVPPGGEHVHVFALLGPVPEPEEAPFYRALLEANLHTTETDGATLCIVAALGEVALCRRFESEGAEPGAFCRAMDAFESTAMAWRVKLAAGL